VARKRGRLPHHMGTVYQRGPGNFWVAFRIGARRGYWRGYAPFAEADKARTKIAADIAAGKIGLEVEKDPVPSLGELFEAWHKRRVKTHQSAKEAEARTGAFGYAVATQEVDARAAKP
jgi:hypothetical protein